MKKENLPNKLAVFPLSNFIIFPKTTVPLNIFEKRYIEMINDSMKKDKLIGMIQPRNFKEQENPNPELHEVGCMGKITSFKETDDNRYLIELKGIIRFQTIKEVNNEKKYREFEVAYEKYSGDVVKFDEEMLEKSDLILHGHTHMHRHEKINECLIFNPGECAGFMEGKNQVGIIDLKNLKVEVINF